MAETYYRIKLSTLTEIGDAIRAKSGATGNIAVTSLATSILDLSPADGADEWDGTGIVIAPIEPVEPNTFTINGTSYQMENRMTWYAWTRSDYNTDSFSCANENDYVYEAESTNRVTDAEGNDVLGTTYIVEGGAYLIKEEATTDELAGTWVFNNTVTGIGLPAEQTIYNVNFVSNNITYNQISFMEGMRLKIEDLAYNSTSVYNSTDGWNGEIYKTITITSKLSEVANDFFNWLEANATKQGAKPLITFTIAGTSYQAEEGMTWGEWVDSEYNTVEARFADFTEGTGMQIKVDGVYKYIYYNEQFVQDTDSIVVDGAYTTTAPATEDELQGTWVFDDYPTVLSGNAVWYVNFTSNNENYDEITIQERPVGIWMWYNSTEVLSGGSAIDFTSWTSTAYKTITITSKLSEVTNGDTLLTWLKANATKQTTQFSMYVDATFIESFTFQDGMTWRDFVNSPYNTDYNYTPNYKRFAFGDTTSANSDIYFNSSGSLNYVRLNIAGSIIKANDYIIDGHNYNISSGSGGGAN